MDPPQVLPLLALDRDLHARQVGASVVQYVPAPSCSCRAAAIHPNLVLCSHSTPHSVLTCADSFVLGVSAASIYYSQDTLVAIADFVKDRVVELSAGSTGSSS